MVEQDLLTIEAKLRKETGKGYCRRLRASGSVIPGNLLNGKTSKAIELNSKWLSKVWQNGKVFNLNLANKTTTVVMKELQINAVKRTAIHVDLMYK